jgi:hypothetical protein
MEYSYESLLYTRVRDLIRPFINDLEAFSRKKRVSYQASAQKQHHKIIAQVFYKCHEIMNKSGDLLNLLQPLLSSL